jgi:hypothetical protein
MIASIAWGIFFINSKKRAFLGQLVISNLNEEFFEILRHFPEGVLIAQVDQLQSEFNRSLAFSKDMQEFLLNLN